ncbi:MAG: hypothetical protein R3D84_15505 [Paracoccaceae bacterium]
MVGNIGKGLASLCLVLALGAGAAKAQDCTSEGPIVSTLFLIGKQKNHFLYKPDGTLHPGANICNIERELLFWRCLYFTNMVSWGSLKRDIFGMARFDCKNHLTPEQAAHLWDGNHGVSTIGEPRN